MVNPEIEFAHATLVDAERTAAKARADVGTRMRAMLPDWVMEIGKAYVTTWPDDAAAVGQPGVKAFKQALGEWAESATGPVVDRPDVYHSQDGVQAAGLRNRLRSYNEDWREEVLDIARAHGFTGIPDYRRTIKIGETTYEVPVPDDLADWTSAENARLAAERELKSLENRQAKSDAAAMWDQA